LACYGGCFGQDNVFGKVDGAQDEDQKGKKKFESTKFGFLVTRPSEAD
jgi:hypothetical protein